MFGIPDLLCINSPYMNGDVRLKASRRLDGGAKPIDLVWNLAMATVITRVESYGN